MNNFRLDCVSHAKGGLCVQVLALHSTDFAEVAGIEFSIADALLMRPLPVLEPSRIAAVTTTSSAAFGANAALSYPDYRDYRDGNRTFAGLIASGFTSFGFSRDAIALPRITFGLLVSGNFFRVLGVQPTLGRGFLESEDQAVGRDPVVVLGHDFWAGEFGASPSVVGSKIRLNGAECTIVGVAPRPRKDRRGGR